MKNVANNRERSRKGRGLEIHHKSTLFTCAEIVEMQTFAVFFPEINLPLRVGAVEDQQLTIDRFEQVVDKQAGIF